MPLQNILFDITLCKVDFRLINAASLTGSNFSCSSWNWRYYFFYFQVASQWVQNLYKVSFALRSDKFEMIFSSRRFFQKTNEQIRLYYLSTCFRSFFGRKWRHQKDISKLTDPLDIIFVADSSIKLQSSQKIRNPQKSSFRVFSPYTSSIIAYHFCDRFFTKPETSKNLEIRRNQWTLLRFHEFFTCLILSLFSQVRTNYNLLFLLRQLDQVLHSESKS